MTTSRARSALSGAWITAAGLFGGIFVGLLAGNAVAAGIPSHMALQVSFGLALIVLALLGGSAFWGSRMAGLGGSAETARMRWAGILGFVPVTFGLGAALLPLESIATEQWGAHLPVHRIFTLLFVPTAFVIVATAGFALGVGLRKPRLGLSLAWRAGSAGALAFLVVNLLMEGLGWQVGGPGAAERYTMLTVTFSGNLGSALTAGAVIGSGLWAEGVRSSANGLLYSADSLTRPIP